MKNLVRDEGTFWRGKEKYYKNVKENYIEREERGTKQVEIDTSGTRIYDYKNVYCLCFFICYARGAAAAVPLLLSLLSLTHSISFPLSVSF